MRGRESRSLVRVGDREDVVDFSLCHPIASEELSCAIRRVSSEHCTIGILTKWLSTPRLETRTKESNIYASIWVSNPRAQ